MKLITEKFTMLNNLQQLILKSAALISTAGLLLYLSNNPSSAPKRGLTSEIKVTQVENNRRPADSFETEYRDEEYTPDDYQEPTKTEDINESSEPQEQDSYDSQYNDDEPLRKQSELPYESEESLDPQNQTFDENEDELYDDYEDSDQEEQQLQGKSPVSSSNNAKEVSLEENNQIRAIANCVTNCSSDSVVNNQSDGGTESSIFSSSSSSSAAPAIDQKPSVSVSTGGGSYSENQSVTLSSNISADIYYCLAEGSCCDASPNSGGTLYSTAIDIGSVDGNYCLSFVGVTSTGVFSDTETQSYLIDSVLPDMSSTVNIQYIQSTQESNIEVTSSKFGEIDFDYGLYQVPLDPSLLNCEEIEQDYLHASFGVDFTGDSVPDFYDLSTVSLPITTPLLPSTMNYGAAGNYFVSILSDRTIPAGVKRTCATHKIILNDFDLFNLSSATTSAPIVNGSGAMEISGTFNSYGIFREPAAMGDVTITSGSSRFEIDPNNILENTKEEIIY